jgi:hypothetical protein
MTHIDQQRLAELKAANLPRATAEDLGLTFASDASDELRAAVAKHCNHYAKPSGGGKCLSCGLSQLGFFGAFTWGLVHGQGFCNECKWPATLYHFIRDEDGEEVVAVWDKLLQAHPDDVCLA